MITKNRLFRFAVMAVSKIDISGLALDAEGIIALITYYEGEESKIKARIAPELKRIDELQELITGLKQRLGFPKAPESLIEMAAVLVHAENKLQGSRFRRSIAALENNNKLLSIKQIIDQWLEWRPNYLESIGTDIQSEQGALAATLKPKVEAGTEILRIKSRSGEFYYGLIEWFTASGRPKKEYLPEEEIEFIYG